MRRLTYFGLLAAAVVLGMSGAGRGDMIELVDGQKLSGTISRQGNAMVIRTDDGRTLSVPPESVLRVTLTGSITRDEAAKAHWTRAAVAIRNADDLQTIIAAHEEFMEKFPDVALAGDVRSSLEVYRRLVETEGVKFRGRWMPKAQIEVVIRQWAEDARPALDLYRSGRFSEAIDSARSVLSKDAMNPDALAVSGLATYRMNSIPQARTFFTSLAEADPGSAVGHNNLAVVCFLQRLPAEGMVHYTRAVQSEPVSRLVLDNVAEALQAYRAGGGDENAEVYRSLMRQYEPVELRMQEEMGRKGLRRWGATWVPVDQAQRLSAYVAGVRDKLDRMEGQYRATREALAQLETYLRQANRDYDLHTQQVNFYNAQILLDPAGYNRTYYLAARDVALQNVDRLGRYRTQLETQRGQIVTSTGEFAAQMERLKSDLSSSLGGYSGTQRMIEYWQQDPPPSPPAVPEPGLLPVIPAIVIAPPPPPPPAPAVVPVPVFVPVPVDRGGRGGEGRGDDGRGGDDRGSDGRGGDGRGRGGRGDAPRATDTPAAQQG